MLILAVFHNPAIRVCLAYRPRQVCQADHTRTSGLKCVPYLYGLLRLSVKAQTACAASPCTSRLSAQAA